MVRIRLYLDEAILSRREALARLQGRTISALTRRTLDRAYGKDADERQATLLAIDGLWKGRTDLEGTREYVRRLRGKAPPLRPRLRPRE